MWAEFAIFIKSKIFRKILKEASLVKDNIITEEGVYYIRVLSPEDDYDATTVLKPNVPQTIYLNSNLTYLKYNPYDSPNFSLRYNSDNFEIEDSSVSVYRLI